MRNRITTGNTIFLTTFNESRSDAFYWCDEQPDQVSLKYCGPIFQKSKFMIINWSNHDSFENKIIENLHVKCMKNLSVRFRSSLNKICLEWGDWSSDKVSSKSVVWRIDILIFIFFTIIISENIKFVIFIGKSTHP